MVPDAIIARLRFLRRQGAKTVLDGSIVGTDEQLIPEAELAKLHTYFGELLRLTPIQLAEEIKRLENSGNRSDRHLNT